MGTTQSLLSADQIDEYIELTYLTKRDLNLILKKFSKIIPSDQIAINVTDRYTKLQIFHIVPELQHNPFSDRIFKVFSSGYDDHISFDEFLNLCSIFSEHCPSDVKAAWAFQIFDFDDDKQISKDDLCELIERLVQPSQLRSDEKEHICDVLLEDLDLQHVGGLNQMEFQRAVCRIPDFQQVFSFKQ